MVDDKVHMIKREEFPIVNILSKDKSLEDALDIVVGGRGHSEDIIKTVLFSIKEPTPIGVIHEVEGLERIHNFGSETAYLTNFFATHRKIKATALYFSNTLDIRSTPDDVRFRQEGVKELITNKNLAQHVYKILSNKRLFELNKRPGAYYNIKVLSKFMPEDLTIFLEDILALQKYTPKSGPIMKLIGWANMLSEDTLFRELFVKKRKVTDSRLFAVYSERYHGIKYGLLKPGVKSEDVFDFLEEKLLEKDVRLDSKGKLKYNHRMIVKYKNPLDEKIQREIMLKARQRMDQVNEMTADNFMLQTLLAQTQLQQLYQGVVFHNYLKNTKQPLTFPIIEDEHGHMELNHVMPIRILFNNALLRNKEQCCPNDFYFRPEDQIIQVEGPNNRGKSEAWRTIHLANYLINAGYSIPADYARWSVYDRSHFISCKGNAGSGGSELGNSIKSITEKLKFVNPNDLVILDELGDSTNKYTAQELGDRILEPLRDIHCRILITSHHDALTSRITKKYGGISLTPDPSAEGMEKFRLKPLKIGTHIDYKANEILDDIGFTKDFVKNTFSTGYKMQSGKNIPEEDENDDLPF